MSLASTRHPREKPPLILALSGGGYRGYFTALVLAGLEKRLGVPANRIFDLIAGTSIGGILALGLAHGVPAETLAAMIKEHGPAIFPSSPFNSARRLFRASYSSDPLAQAVRKILPKDHGAPIGCQRRRQTVPDSGVRVYRSG